MKKLFNGAVCALSLLVVAAGGASAQSVQSSSSAAQSGDLPPSPKSDEGVMSVGKCLNRKHYVADGWKRHVTGGEIRYLGNLSDTGRKPVDLCLSDPNTPLSEHMRSYAQIYKNKRGGLPLLDNCVAFHEADSEVVACHMFKRASTGWVFDGKMSISVNEYDPNNSCLEISPNRFPSETDFKEVTGAVTGVLVHTTDCMVRLGR